MKCTWNKKDNMKNKKEADPIASFICYTISKRSSWLVFVFSLIFVNTLIGIGNVYTPKWILTIIQKKHGEIGSIIFSIVMIELCLFLFKTVGSVLQNRLAEINDSLFRSAYADLGMAQSQVRYDQAISAENLKLLEGGKYGIWEIPSLSNKLERLGSSVALLILNAMVISLHDWRYLFIPVVCNLLLLPLYRRVTEIELDNAKRLLPENRSFGWYCKLISDFQIAEDIRIYQGKELVIKRCGSLMDRIYEINQRAFSQKGLHMGMIKFLLQIQIVAVALILGNSFTGNAMQIEDFVLYFSAICAISNAGNEIVTRVNQVRKSGALLVPFFIFQKERRDLAQTDFTSQKKQIQLLTFDNVSFTYPGNTKKSLNHVSFSIKRGEHVGIVGRNGAGKSTIAKLICRLYTPQEGRILIDGIDISTMDEETYKSYIAVLFQDFQLLPVKLIENILCKPRESMTEMERTAFLKLVESTDLLPWISSLPAKEETYISPDLSKDYVTPSGGEAQFLAMLRAVSRNTSICLFDEPTMALDSDHEKAVLHMLEALDGEICLMISHRLSHVKRMDRILVMDDGEIIESGTHDSLIQLNGIYQHMYSIQAAKYGVELEKRGSSSEM